MDSLSQLALGAAVGVAVMGRHTAVWKAALWGGIAGTLPDLDALIDHGDAVRNMVLHRSHSHGLFWLTLGAPLLAGLAAVTTRGRGHHRLAGGPTATFGRWWLAMWLALVTHPLLDTMTVYGTQLAQPFSSHPYGVGSIFIIDPLYTLPLLAGCGLALARRAPAGLRANAWGLALSTLYLAWTALAQLHVTGVVRAQLGAAPAVLAAQAAPPASEATAPGTPPRILVTPAPMQSLLWRVVVVRDNHYEEGFYSLLDGGRPIRFEAFPTDRALERELAPVDAVRSIAAFSGGFYRVRAIGDQATITDLRMGQEPGYVFSFRVARREGGAWLATLPTNEGFRTNVKAGLSWLWARMWGADLAPPR
jgi:inner membrane protein